MSNRTCEHVQVDGLRCTNPAMYRRRVCYHHWRLLRPRAEKSNLNDSPDNPGRASAAPPTEISDHHQRSDNRGRAGLQPRVADPENSGALAPAASPKKPPLSATQAKLLKKILRHGPKHPQFHKAAHLLDHHVSATRQDL